MITSFAAEARRTVKMPFSSISAEFSDGYSPGSFYVKSVTGEGNVVTQYQKWEADDPMLTGILAGSGRKSRGAIMEGGKSGAA